MSVPGTFIIVDHSIERAFNRGALAQLKVTGPEDKLVYSGKQFDLVYQPEGTGIRVAGQRRPRRRRPGPKRSASSWARTCSPTIARLAIRRTDKGVPDAFPPLAKSDYLNGDKIRAIKTVTGGLETKLTVNGHEFNGMMPAWSLSDEDIGDVLTYGFYTWGNSGLEVTPDEVKTYRMSGEAVTRAATAIAAATLVGSLAVSARGRGRSAPAWSRRRRGSTLSFLKVKALNDGEAAARRRRGSHAFRIDVEPVTNAQFLEFVAEPSPMAEIADQGSLRR